MVLIQIWDEQEVARISAAVEGRAIALSQMGERGLSASIEALGLAASLRSAGQALNFADEDDAETVFIVLERLDDLKRRADGLLLLWSDDITIVFDDRMQRRAREYASEEEVTRVVQRVVMRRSN